MCVLYNKPKKSTETNLQKNTIDYNILHTVAYISQS